MNFRISVCRQIDINGCFYAAGIFTVYSVEEDSGKSHFETGHTGHGKSGKLFSCNGKCSGFTHKCLLKGLENADLDLIFFKIAAQPDITVIEVNPCGVYLFIAKRKRNLFWIFPSFWVDLIKGKPVLVWDFCRIFKSLMNAVEDFYFNPVRQAFRSGGAAGIARKSSGNRVLCCSRQPELSEQSG